MKLAKLISVFLCAMFFGLAIALAQESVTGLRLTPAEIDRWSFSRLEEKV